MFFLVNGVIFPSPKTSAILGNIENLKEINEFFSSEVPHPSPPCLSSKPWLWRGADFQFGDIKGRGQAPG